MTGSGGVTVGVGVNVGVMVGVAVGVNVAVNVGVEVGVGVNAVHWPLAPLQLAPKTGTQPVKHAPLVPEPHAGTPEKLH
jgi:hypothetical protein